MTILATIPDLRNLIQNPLKYSSGLHYILNCKNALHSLTELVKIPIGFNVDP